MADNKEYITYPEERGSINISEEVVAAIACGAALEVEGVDGLFNSPGKKLPDAVGRKALSRDVKVRVADGDITADVSIITKVGYAVSTVGREVQEAVKAAVEATTGLSVSTVNVHICGISFK